MYSTATAQEQGARLTAMRHRSKKNQDNNNYFDSRCHASWAEFHRLWKST